MAKRLQVVLNKSVNKLGKSGEVVDVAPGYARNYLVPQGLASIATRGTLRQVAQRQEQERQRKLAELEQAKARKVAFKTIGRLVIKKQVGEGEAIFGTVTTQEVADIIKTQTGQDIDRKTITLPEISKIGMYEAQIKLHSEVTADVQIEVVAL